MLPLLIFFGEELAGLLIKQNRQKVTFTIKWQYDSTAVLNFEGIINKLKTNLQT